MSNGNDVEDVAKGVFNAFVAFIAVGLGYLLLITVAAVAMLAGVVVAFLAILAAKSGKALVEDEDAGSALVGSVFVAAGLTIAIVVGSVALLILSDMATHQYRFGGTRWIGGTGWIGEIFDDSVWFFGSLIPVCFLANRIFVARRAGGSAWLGIIPPLIAMLIFSIAIQADEIAALWQNPSREIVMTIWDRTLVNLRQPIDLVVLGWQSPDALRALLMERIGADWPNLFKVAHFFPTAFSAFAISMAGRALISP